MIIGSHLEKIFSSNEEKSENSYGLKHFPANKVTKLNYDSNRPLEQRHIYLNLDIDFKNNTLHGVAHIIFQTKLEQIETFFLDANELNIFNVAYAPFNFEDYFSGKKNSELSLKKLEKIQYKECAYESTSDKLNITLPVKLKSNQYFILKVKYNTIEPNAGMYFIHKLTKSHAKYNCIWTQGQDTDASYWFPCQNDPRLKITTDIEVTFPKDWNALSNGIKVSEKIEGNKKYQHWKMNKANSPYLVALVAGELELYSDTWRKKEVAILIPQEHKKQKEVILNETKEMLEFYSNYWDYEFPWEKYGQAFIADFIYGGMENTSITINTDEVLGPVHFSLGSDFRSILIMHEMAHQWFGDLLTCKTWAQGWLNEGFATQSEMLWDEYKNGKVSGIFYARDHFLSGYLSEAKSYLRPIVCSQYEYPAEIFDAHLYQKAALFLNYLRDIMGEIIFKKSINHYLNKNAYKAVETADLMNAMQECSGINPAPYFDNFIFRGGHLVLDVQVAMSELNPNFVEIKVEQKQEISKEFPLFSFETYIALYYADGSNEEIKVFVDEKIKKIILPLKQKISFCIFDPRSTLISETEQKIPEIHCRNILKNNDSSLAYLKYIATKCILAHFPSQENLKYILAWLKIEPSFRARESTYSLLAEKGSQYSYDLLVQIEERHSLCRTPYLTALAKCYHEQPSKIFEQLVKLSQNEKENLHAQRAALLGINQLSKNYSLLRKEEYRKKILKLADEIIEDGSSHGLLENAAFSLIAELGNSKYIAKLIPITEEFIQHWRINTGALMALAQIVSRYPELRSEVRPALNRFAKIYFPTRVVMCMPQVWIASQDPWYENAFYQYVNRKNYGLFSILIPLARRTLAQFAKNIEKEAIGEKLVEIVELKEKLAHLEKEIKELKLILPLKEKQSS
ncbi:M1 family metallopeptidase [Fluviispira sanaruensis]|uniref:Aminopeptidase N n=1 Tax=Fluviispira sanaruensis TaxID=2493639 RepID=A0A4V0P2K8_FLUSA|nr:M1 family metallopeptidase [Fluviispira sanaruensis]BBH53577.1 aminopeptidase [Fluviispira sanaruensis]